MAQEACLRAFSFFQSFRGEDGRAWLLAIVRNTCYTWLRRNRAQDLVTALDPAEHAADAGPNPEELQLRQADADTLRRALEELPAEFREVLVLRELEGMSYKQLARILEIPIGTVMSRLTRGRKRLLETLRGEVAGATT